MSRKTNVMRRILYTVLILLFCGSFAGAQNVIPKASLDTMLLLIGDQAKLHLEVETSIETEVAFPQLLGNKLEENIEVLEGSAIDTFMLDAQHFRLSQDFILTSFDTGFYVISPFWFQIKNGDQIDSACTESLMMYVATIPKLDSLMQALQGPLDIKPPVGAPLTFKEVAPWILGIILVAAIIFFIVYAIIRYKRKLPIFGGPPKPKEPAHIVAFRELDRIKDEKIWQQGLTKQFYSELTDVLRVYIADRFEISAKEQTSDEIISAFKYRTSLLDADSFDKLKSTLEMADLVKFAKYEPLPDDNSSALTCAYMFVDKTKIVVLEEPNGAESESTASASSTETTASTSEK